MSNLWRVSLLDCVSDESSLVRRGKMGQRTPVACLVTVCKCVV